MPRYFIIIAFYLFFASTLIGQAKSMTIDEYIAKFKDIAIQEMERSGIPASITLAQGIHESAVGNGSLAKDANNHFGIKCTKDWKGESVLKWDDDPQESCFRKYNNAEESYIDHTDFLLNRKHYAFLFDYGRTSYRKWAYGLKKAGYATDPQYPEKLISAINKYKLHVYDRELGPLFYAKDTSTVHLLLASGGKLRTKPRSFLFEAKKSLLYHQNGSTYTVSRKGESLLAVAKRLEINYDNLLRFNDMHDGDRLMDYQPVYINLKRSVYRGQDAFYKVENDVTMYEISQYYAIKLSSLLALNLLASGEEPLNGEMIMLKEKAFKKPKLRPSNHVDTLPSPYIDVEADSIANQDNRPIVLATETPVKTTPISIPVIERPQPQDLEVNTPTYSPVIYADTTHINTSTSKDNEYLKIIISPSDTSSIIGSNSNNNSTSNLSWGEDPFLKPVVSNSTENNTANNSINSNSLFTNTNSNTISSPRIGDNNVYNPPVNNSNSNPIENNPTTNNVVETPKTKTHIVQKGETLYRIYKLYNVPVESIQKANQLKDTSIKEGDKLIIPVQ